MRPAVKKLLVFLTDGKNSPKAGSLRDAANQLKRIVDISYAVGVGRYNIRELQMIATAPENVFESGSFAELGDVIQKLTPLSCKGRL